MYDYQLMSLHSIAEIAQGQTPRIDGLTVEVGALPPQPVAQRIVAALENGTLPLVGGDSAPPARVISSAFASVIAGRFSAAEAARASSGAGCIRRPPRCAS